MPELWAYCEPCDRAFYVPFDTSEQMAQAQCPVCTSEPVSFEIRTDSSAFEVVLDEAPLVS